MPNIKRSVLILGLFTAGLIAFISCRENIESPPLVLEITDELEQVEGAEQADMTLRQGEAVGRDSWFEVELSGIESAGTITNGITEGWCVEWQKDIAQNDAAHNGVRIFSTEGKERWRPLNHLLTIKDRLQREDPDLTFREIQAAIWSVVDGSDFDVDMPAGDMPPRLTKDGQVNFDRQKVKAIVEQVKTNATARKADSAGKYALFIQSSEDEQTITVPSKETVSHGYVEGVTPVNIDSENAERTYPVIKADWEGPGGDSRWLGWNLGATQPPASVDDNNSESVGWYFKFLREQGYYHGGANGELVAGNPGEGGSQIPTTGFEGDWTENDPCTALLGNGWRIPTETEWQAVIDANADLNLHFAGGTSHDLGITFGRGSAGHYWTSTEFIPPSGESVYRGETVTISNDGTFESNFNMSKATGLPLRCIEG